MTPETLETLTTAFDDGFFLIGLAILAIEILKALFSRTLKGRTLLDMVASVSTQIPFLVFEILILSFAYVGYVLIEETFVSWTFPLTFGVAALALLAADFVYYWEHRTAHQVRLFWTQHAVHHSSRHMNITVAVRFGPLEGVLSAIFHLPLVLIGFPAELVFASILLVQAYQTWIHTELIGKLGPLDAIFNTPSNHRVHHGCDDDYIDTNYGGILILWDRLFGTWRPEHKTPKYGLKRDFDSVNPLAVWISELPRFFADLKSAPTAAEAWKRAFGRPDRALVDTQRETTNA